MVVAEVAFEPGGLVAAIWTQLLKSFSEKIFFLFLCNLAIVSIASIVSKYSMGKCVLSVLASNIGKQAFFTCVSDEVARKNSEAWPKCRKMTKNS